MSIIWKRSLFVTPEYAANMDYDYKCSLAKTGDADHEASSIRLRAARSAIGFSQEQLGVAGGVKKTAIANAEQGRAFPGRDVLIYLYREHRIDLNFMINGDFVQLPGDVQDRLFAALEVLSNGADRK
ncbi:MAG: helix-turn-helix transcriptional regulator, partial [Pseudomonadota bacterium]|jgi:DNA-binding XRE family transcriptional regulator|uniref:helix-turn-helix domain-containing protein n=1 Tax=Thalassovita sp. TaxID=1979401 RepID=UPI002AB27EB2|nr:helix-turn-helix transcriptional regulator [Thalassovita sp.]MEC8039818.1 helix-turn-helix transcriptional regulator [Pseudomonadota bacterium]